MSQNPPPPHVETKGGGHRTAVAPALLLITLIHACGERRIISEPKTQGGVAGVENQVHVVSAKAVCCPYTDPELGSRTRATTAHTRLPKPKSKTDEMKCLAVYFSKPMMLAFTHNWFCFIWL